jgi:hypothetical protein
VNANPLKDPGTNHGYGTKNLVTRSRAIGTSKEIGAVENPPVSDVVGGEALTTDILGYAFWNVAAFSNATTMNGKYLTVDGIDPLQELYITGEIPTPANAIPTPMSNVQNGRYPIWSFLRVVCDPGTETPPNTNTCPAVQNLAAFAQDAEAFGSGSDFQPDFVGNELISLVRSHFSPPGVVYPSSTNCTCNGGACTPLAGNSPPYSYTPPVVCTNPSDGYAIAAENPEAGGDVGGFVYTLQADADYTKEAKPVANGGPVGHRE